ncbi:MAG: multiheme c-type cytochrome [Pseudomonadota bacterium]
MNMIRPVELSILLLLISGLMVTEYTEVPWDVKRWALTVHIASAIVFFPSVIILFWVLHRGNLSFSRRAAQRRTGRFIELFLIIMFLCGLWLLFIGENFTRVGNIAHIVHLLTAIPLVVLIIWHSWRRSLLRAMLNAVGLAALLGLAIGASMPAGNVFAQKTGEHPAVSSSSLIFNADKSVIYSANFETGSVSKIDRKDGSLLAETALGREIRTVALSADEKLLAVTDHGGDMFHVLDADTLKPKAVRPLLSKPYGVVYDARNEVFWVTVGETHKLYGLDKDARIKHELEVAETPRGLALMPDGRLFITHALIGTVSIYDTTVAQPKLVKTIKLVKSTNLDPTKSQGLPRALDRIVLSPDLKQAWLPHHLWNFTHPFQFQTNLFPTLSVLWMEKGHEHEVVNRRKQMFEQINIIEAGNVQRIVSNPYDAVFSKDGTKVFAVMAGSEDLVTFDLTRAPPITGDEGPDGTQGALASQIFALPGQNPRGVVIDGEELFVQNAMSLDISTISSGGGGPFSQMSVSKASFAKLVTKDPLDPKLRRGLRLFHLAKTAAFPKSPIAGRNWMSCASCHLTGFNYTNGYLFRDTTRDITQNAVPGHFSLKTFVSGDFVAEYIRMIKQTQGGMGFDTQNPTPDIDPEKPPPEVASMMHDLHTYVTSDYNLPLLSTWLRGDNGTGSVDHTDWINPALCGSCHTQIYEEWSGSMHRLMGESNPYYVVLEDLAAKEVGEDFRVWCMGCHAPQALLSGKRNTEGKSHLFEKDGASLKAELSQFVHAIDEGTGCIFCHRTEKVEMAGPLAGGNSSVQISLADRITYPGEDSPYPPLRWLAERAIRAEPEEHAKSFTPDAIQGPKFCSACHEEFTPGVAAQTTSTYSEWAASQYNNKEDPSASTTCNDCHMNLNVTGGKPEPGIATNHGPVIENYRSHKFIGAQYHLVGLRSPERRKLTVNHLKSAAHVETSFKAKADGTGEVVVRVSNVGAGHNLPTGVSDFRQLWLDVTVTDASGNQVVSSGRLDKDGNLDPKARMFANVFGDGDSHQLGLEFWNYRKLLEDTRIPPGGHRDEAYVVPKSAKQPLKVEVKLMFRTFPQKITDEVRKRFPEMPAPKAVELHNVTSNLGNS